MQLPHRPWPWPCSSSWPCYSWPHRPWPCYSWPCSVELVAVLVAVLELVAVLLVAVLLVAVLLVAVLVAVLLVAVLVAVLLRGVLDAIGRCEDDGPMPTEGDVMQKHSPGFRAHLPAPGARWPITVDATVRTAWGTITLHRDNKTTSGTRLDSQGRWSAIPNAFMLPAGPSSLGGTCGEIDGMDGLTSKCAGCYAANLERAYPSFRSATERNLDTLLAAHAAGGAGAVADVLVQCVEHSARAQRAAGVVRPLFRHQSDGDIIDGWHADAIRIAAERTPDVAHWLYTRKARAAARIVAAGRPSNLAVLLSADAENIRAMLTAAAVLELPIAYLSDGTAEDDANIGRIAEVTGRRAIGCPATGAWTHDGRGPAHIVGSSGRRADMGPGARVGAGACAACAKCVHENGPSIVFDRHGGAPKRTAHEVFVALRSRA